MNWPYSIRCHYLDASALVKLVADDPDEEPGREVLRTYYREHSHRFATSYSVTEALNAFKSKYLRKRIGQDEYVRDVQAFIRTVIGNNLQIDQVDILLPIVCSEGERLIKTYEIDFLDAFQIVTIMRGKFASMARESQLILITADRTLAQAARSERARVWECTSESPPP